ncbi:MAG TPA: thymidylate synthase, partial [Anaerolineae bacterium]|nr:thymidylate synthase [Anaerolineae bacterium]
YGDRLRNYDGLDQISNLIELIRERPDSKRMFVTTWKVGLDSRESKTGDAPCLTQMNATVRDGCIVLTAHFRSQDMFSAWPMNMFAVRKLHKLICDQSNLELGPTTMITHSAHIYAWDWELAWEIVNQNAREMHSRRWSQDPRGYVVISLEGTQIKVEGFSSQHDKLFELVDSSAARLTHSIGSMDVFVMPSHLMYIGRELQRAETALQLATPYVQDKRAPLDKFRLETKDVQP